MVNNSKRSRAESPSKEGDKRPKLNDKVVEHQISTEHELKSVVNTLNFDEHADTDRNDASHAPVGEIKSSSQENSDSAASQLGLNSSNLVSSTSSGEDVESNSGVKSGLSSNNASENTHIPSQGPSLLNLKVDDPVRQNTTSLTSIDSVTNDTKVTDNGLSDFISQTIRNSALENSQLVQNTLRVAGAKDGSFYLHTYSKQIYQSLLDLEAVEAPKYGYMARQSTVTEAMRVILLDWLTEIHDQHKLHPETLFTTVSLVDRFLEIIDVPRQQLQLLGVTAMWIASKFEESWRHEVGLDEMEYATDKTCKKAVILAMESQILNLLKFRISVPTVYTFLTKLFYVGGIDPLSTIARMALYISELCTLKYEFLQYQPSHLAAAALLMSKKVLDPMNCWSEALQEQSGYSEAQLGELIHHIVTSAVGSSGPTAPEIPRFGRPECVFRKYSTPRYQQVALLLQSYDMYKLVDLTKIPTQFSTNFNSPGAVESTGILSPQTPNMPLK